MSSYYYLVAGLPDLSLDDAKLSCTLSDFKSEIYPALSEKDRKLVDLLFLRFDNKDLLRLLADKEAVAEGKGLFSDDDLRALIQAVRDGDKIDARYPSYMAEFIERYATLQENEKFQIQDLLTSMFYAYAMKCGNTFLASWFKFNLNLNNVLSALTAHKYKMEVAEYIVGEGEVSSQLRTSNARDFGLSAEMDYWESLVRISETENLLDREKKIDQLKWKWLEEESFFHYFTIERLLVFLLQLEMIERWILLDKEKGSELFRQMIQNLKNEVQIPEEFRK